MRVDRAVEPHLEPRAHGSLWHALRHDLDARSFPYQELLRLALCISTPRKKWLGHEWWRVRVAEGLLRGAMLHVLRRVR